MCPNRLSIAGVGRSPT
jgi:hypothetical protein